MPKFANMTTLTGREIRSFDLDARQLVDDFHAAGWRSYLSKNGHAILHAPDGKSTASVSGHSDGPHKSKAARADLERWLRANDNPPPMSREQRRKSKYGRGNAFRRPLRRSFENYPKPEQHHEPEHNNRVQEPTHMATKFGCPDCPDHEPFKTPGALGLHRQRVHGMTCPECEEVFTGGGNAKEYNAHRLERHGIAPAKRASRRAPDGEYPCEFPGCPDVFTTKLGRGGHMKKHKNPANNVPKVATDDGVFSHAAPARAKLPKLTPVPKPAPPKPAPVEPQPTRTLVATGVSTDLDQWLADQNPADLLASVFAVLAPPLVGEIERLRRQRDELTQEVGALGQAAEALRAKTEEYEARMSLIREAHKAQDEAMNL